MTASPARVARSFYDNNDGGPAEQAIGFLPESFRHTKSEGEAT